MSNTVEVGDNLSVASTLAAGSIDLIYVDPPFGTGSKRTSGSGHTYDDRLPKGMPEYLEHLRARFHEFHRVLGQHGSLFVHLDYRATHYVRVMLDEIFGHQRFVNEIIWGYAVGGKSRRSFGRKHDTILWYSKGRDYYFDGDAVRVARKGGSHMKVEFDEEGRPVQVKRDAKSGKVYRYPVHLGKIPEDVWTDIPSLNRSDRERCGWPTQKPLALLTRIIKAASPPDGLVADFYSGSGTTLVAAQQCGRRYLGVDISPEAVALAQERLANYSRDSSSATMASPTLDMGDALSGPTMS